LASSAPPAKHQSNRPVAQCSVHREPPFEWHFAFTAQLTGRSAVPADLPLFNNVAATPHPEREPAFSSHTSPSRRGPTTRSGVGVRSRRPPHRGAGWRVLHRQGVIYRLAARSREGMSKSSPSSERGMARRKAQTYWCPRSFWDRGGRLSARHMRICSELPLLAQAGFAKAGAVAHAICDVGLQRARFLLRSGSPPQSVS
jgi:hypothetical protein